MHDKGSPLLNRPDYVVCTCMSVMYSEIKLAIEQGYDTLEALAEHLFVGTGCSSCHAEVLEMIARYKRN